MPQFTDSLVGENVAVATEYFKTLIASTKSGGSIGFIPFNVSFTIDGLSGIKIYNELTLDVSFLPPGYSKTLDFIVTGVGNKLKDGDWETDINATLIPKTDGVNNILKASAPVTKQKENYEPPISTTPSTTPSTPPSTGGTAIQGNQKLSTVLQNAGYTPGTFLYEWALTQGTIEGYGPAKTIATRQNNPGNLTGKSYPHIDPKSSKIGRFTVFSTPELGAKAMVQEFLVKWSQGNYPGTIVNGSSSQSTSYRNQWKVPASLSDIAGKKVNLNAEQFYYIYAPPSENNTENYINNVVKSLQKKFPGFNRNEKLINWINK